MLEKHDLPVRIETERFGISLRPYYASLEKHDLPVRIETSPNKTLGESWYLLEKHDLPVRIETFAISLRSYKYF